MSRNSAVSTLSSAIFYSAWVTFAVLLGSSILAGIVLVVLMIAVGDIMSIKDSALFSVSMYAMQYLLALFVVMIVPFIQVAGKWNLLLPMLGFLRWPRFGDLVKAIPAWLLYFGATLSVLALVAALFPSLNLDEAQDVGFDGISKPYEYVLAFIALAVLPPLAEEAIFRGYLYGKLRSFMRFWPTTLLVSLTFAVVHLQINVGIDVFILSIALCYLREKTGTIWASVFLHSLKNSIAYYFLFIHQ